MGKRRFVFAITGALWLFAAGGIASLTTQVAVAAGETEHALVSSGVTRSYLLHVPAGYDGRAIPLVFNFHGSLLVPQDQVDSSRLGAVADRGGFAVVYPAGVFAAGNLRNAWNPDREQGVDDIQLVRDLIEDVAAKIEVDRSRIYATGFSGGGRISSRLACELSDVLAAAAPVAGLQYYAGCTPARAISILTIHGNADRFNHYERRDDSPPYWHMGVETAVEQWRAANGCGSEPTVAKFNEQVEVRAWTGCRDGTEIAFYVVEGGDHVWTDFASEVIWEFFSRHSAARAN
jgi:polyhydroxybutyrate depolymerase